MVWALTSTTFVIWETAVGRAKRFRKTTGLRHLATSKCGTLRETIRRQDRPQKHSNCRDPDIGYEPSEIASDVLGELAAVHRVDR